MVNGDGFSIWLDCCLMIHLFLIDFIWFMVNILPGFCCIKFIVFTVSNNYSRAVIMWDDLFELLGRWLTSASSPKMKMRMRVLSLLMLCLIASTYCQGKLLNAPAVFWCYLSAVTIDGPNVVNAHVFENSNTGKFENQTSVRFQLRVYYSGTQVVDFHVAGHSNVSWSLNSTSNFTINSEGVVSVGGVLDREVRLFTMLPWCSCIEIHIVVFVGNIGTSCHQSNSHCNC